MTRLCAYLRGPRHCLDGTADVVAALCGRRCNTAGPTPVPSRSRGDRGRPADRGSSSLVRSPRDCPTRSWGTIGRHSWPSRSASARPTTNEWDGAITLTCSAPRDAVPRRPGYGPVSRLPCPIRQRCGWTSPRTGSIVATCHAPTRPSPPPRPARAITRAYTRCSPISFVNRDAGRRRPTTLRWHWQKPRRATFDRYCRRWSTECSPATWMERIDSFEPWSSDTCETHGSFCYERSGCSGTGQLAAARALADRGPWFQHEDPSVVTRRVAIEVACSRGKAGKVR